MTRVSKLYRKVAVLAWTSCAFAACHGQQELTITTQPVSVIVADGEPASFNVVATGGKGPVIYQWQRNGNELAGNSNATLLIPATIYTYNNNDVYKVLVADATGKQLVSNAATLTILPLAPVIIESPLSQTIDPNATARFAVAAVGSIPLTYQWSVNGNAIAEGNTLVYMTGANNYPQNDQDTYTVTITNAAGQTTTSSPAILTVSPVAQAPKITIDCSHEDKAVAHQIDYLRGVVESFDIGNVSRPPATIVSTVVGDMQAASVNSLNATLDINSAQDANFFTSTAASLNIDSTATSQLVETFSLLRNTASPAELPAIVQVSGTPAAPVRCLSSFSAESRLRLGKSNHRSVRHCTKQRHL